MAFEAGLDLVEIAPEGKPPVCKIMDFGRYRFEREKRERKSAKTQQTTELKELQLTCNIGQHDLQTKLDHATRFLTAGNKVKVIVKFRGREMAHTERGRDLLDRFAAGVEELGTVEKVPLLDGRNTDDNGTCPQEEYDYTERKREKWEKSRRIRHPPNASRQPPPARSK